MRFFRKLGFEKIAWSLRRAYTPVSEDALVLEVGSGGNPYPRANVLLDAYEETRERHFVPLKLDRPFVLGFVENLPFKDQSFDFVIASHVLEHSKDPDRFLNELMRVARAGYIEVPDAFMERVNPYQDHRLEIFEDRGTLVIKKKPDWKTEPDTVSLYERHAKKWMTGETIPAHPFDFHVRYYWRSKIPYKVLNPEVDAGWKETGSSHHREVQSRTIVAQIKTKVMDAIRYLGSQNKRNRMLDLLSLMQCTHCRSGKLMKNTSGDQIQCTECHHSFVCRNGIPIMQ